MGDMVGISLAPACFYGGTLRVRKKIWAVGRKIITAKTEVNRLDINKEKELCPQDIN